MGTRGGAGEIARRLILLKDAEADLAGIFDFSIDVWGLNRAAAYRDRLREVMDGLLTFPGGGAPFDPRLSGVRSIKAGEHRIFYTADNDEVRIVRILHAAMDAKRHLP